MASFSEDLRAERERQGLTLKSLCAETRVQERYFTALEHGDYTALPGGVFRKGIVRAYLGAAGLPEQEWLPRFQQSLDEHARAQGTGLAADPEAWAVFAENVRRNRAGSGRRNSMRWVGILAMLLLLAAGAGAVWHFLLKPQMLPW